MSSTGSEIKVNNTYTLNSEKKRKKNIESQRDKGQGIFLQQREIVHFCRDTNTFYTNASRVFFNYIYYV